MVQEFHHEAFHPPESEDKIAGRLRYRRAPSAYETFMQEQGIPIYRGIGVHDVRELPLSPWKRIGGRGTFLYLDGTGIQKGIYVAEIPVAGVLNPERHIYEEIFYVVEGRGSTEIWREGSSKKQAFEWQAGSLFSVPLNTYHRLVNATSSPALLLVATTAPAVMNLFRNQGFVFNNAYEFTDRYDGAERYFIATDTVEPHPAHGRAVRRSNLFPDVARCEMPLDNQRSPGYRRFEPAMADNTFYLFIGEHASGRYSTAHAHSSGDTAVLVCLRGRGYTLSWPRTLGIHPWEDGKADQVKRQDYVPGGMVCAAPGGGECFHQHFGVGKDPLRVLALLNPTAGGGRRRGSDDEVTSDNADLRDGGATIGYDIEDPYIRKLYQQELAKEGAEFRMPESVYRDRSAGAAASEP